MFLRILLSFTIALLLSSSGHAQDIPQDPRAVIEELTPYQSKKGWDAYYQALREEVAHRPEIFLPIIREYIRRPDRLQDFDMDDADFRLQLWRSSRVVTNVVPSLGRKHAEPILFEVFTRDRPLFEQAVAADEHAHRELRARGWTPGAELLPEERANLKRIGLLEVIFSGRMSRAIVVASQLQSPVLVDSVLEFYEAGLEDRQSRWPQYPLLFAAERPDVIPRLRAIEADPETPSFVRNEIKSAFEWYAQTLAEAEAGAPVLAEANPHPPASSSPALSPTEDAPANPR